MGLLQSLLFGREKGLRKTILRRLGRNLMGSPSRTSRESLPQEPPPMDLSVDLPQGYHLALRRNELAEGQIRQVIVGGVALAIAHVEGDRWYAISNDCPHAGGALGEGNLRGTIVTCSQHGWGFDLTSGACTVNPDDTVPCFPIAIKGDNVGVDLRGSLP